MLFSLVSDSLLAYVQINTFKGKHKAVFVLAVKDRNLARRSFENFAERSGLWFIAFYAEQGFVNSLQSKPLERLWLRRTK